MVVIGNPTESISSLSGDLNTVGGAHALGDANGNLYPRSLICDNIADATSITTNNTIFF